MSRYLFPILSMPLILLASCSSSRVQAIEQWVANSNRTNPGASASSDEDGYDEVDDYDTQGRQIEFYPPESVKVHRPLPQLSELETDIKPRASKKDRYRAPDLTSKLPEESLNKVPTPGPSDISSISNSTLTITPGSSSSENTSRNKEDPE